MVKKILKILFAFLLVLLIIELLLYFSAPVYDFPTPQPFYGEKIHNPYQGMDPGNWKKANFHFHLRAWGGITSGRGNTPGKFWKTYKKLGYDVPCVSDYMRINTFNKDSLFYIPAYEHGFGIWKKHHLLLGAKKVLWMDYSVFQNLNHKQHLLNLLRGQNEIVAIAHPDWENGFSLNDLKYLSNYDLLEVLDANWRSVPLWDAALSSGHPVFIVSDDDAHNLRDPYQIGRCCTFVNSPVLNARDILAALRKGLAFGAEIYMATGETFDEKAIRAREIPVLRSVEVRNDTLWVSTDKQAKSIEFIGQDGRLLKEMDSASSGWYKIRPEDPYVRPEIRFFNNSGGTGTIFYLNPVFRYRGKIPGNELRAKINYTRTWILRLFSIPSLFALIALIFYMRRKQRDKKIAHDQ